MQNSLLQSRVWIDPWHVTEYTCRHWSKSQGEKSFPPEERTDDKPRYAWWDTDVSRRPRGCHLVLVQGSRFRQTPNTVRSHTDSCSFKSNFRFSARNITVKDRTHPDDLQRRRLRVEPSAGGRVHDALLLSDQEASFTAQQLPDNTVEVSFHGSWFQSKCSESISMVTSGNNNNKKPSDSAEACENASFQKRLGLSADIRIATFAERLQRWNFWNMPQFHFHGNIRKWNFWNCAGSLQTRESQLFWNSYSLYVVSLPKAINSTDWWPGTPTTSFFSFFPHGNGHCFQNIALSIKLSRERGLSSQWSVDSVHVDSESPDHSPHHVSSHADVCFWEERMDPPKCKRRGHWKRRNSTHMLTFPTIYHMKVCMHCILGKWVLWGAELS